MNRKLLLSALCLPVLAACTTVPTGPSVMALPGNNKSFEQFRQDDMECRQYALYQGGGQTANNNAVNSGLASAAVGTAVGAAAGALLGGNHQGAQAGAGAGLLLGSAAGTGSAQAAGAMTQRRYDNSYVQCMYAKGEKVPVYGGMGSRGDYGYGGYPPPPPGSYPPPANYGYPPPPGSYPPPPPYYH
ncbi:glycine zipper family protein [Crenobacter sp. SG2303]|uniref:Glycine zipper family protein n=1 Tax=Crenobacter oryzisoli TaxID=3056844 RepID=A0ABT7XJP3_9NEIS|nr:MULTISPECIES: glycine zipper family protein [unclassified Crenobacter]MDN0074009.1 glycine zipper family protein [Crenobacter sp. SG2303]MDN0085439.1 glycine zipper family protein [Crenobacter sp. SG2305]